MTEPTPYRDPQWKIVRPLVLERDSHLCQLRLPNCKTTATHVDHLIDWRDGGDWFALHNLQAACSSCNVAKRNRGVAARARAHRGTPTPATPTGVHTWEHASHVHGTASWCSPNCPAQHPAGRPNR